jgi:activator of HSP90 ATPase
MSESLHLEIVLPTTPEIVYKAWLDSTKHRDFTGGNAVIEAHAGGAFSSWDGYIKGILLKLEPYKRIVQSWKTMDFPEGYPASHLEILFEPAENGTRLTVNHTEIPKSQLEQVELGWREYYFVPMLGYFSVNEDEEE